MIRGLPLMGNPMCFRWPTLRSLIWRPQCANGWKPLMETSFWAVLWKTFIFYYVFVWLWGFHRKPWHPYYLIHMCFPSSMRQGLQQRKCGSAVGKTAFTIFMLAPSELRPSRNGLGATYHILTSSHTNDKFKNYWMLFGGYQCFKQGPPVPPATAKWPYRTSGPSWRCSTKRKRTNSSWESWASWTRGQTRKLCPRCAGWISGYAFN